MPANHIGDLSLPKNSRNPGSAQQEKCTFSKRGVSGARRHDRSEAVWPSPLGYCSVYFMGIDSSCALFNKSLMCFIIDSLPVMFGSKRSWTSIITSWDRFFLSVQDVIRYNLLSKVCLYLFCFKSSIFSTGNFVPVMLFSFGHQLHMMAGGV